MVVQYPLPVRCTLLTCPANYQQYALAHEGVRLGGRRRRQP